MKKEEEELVYRIYSLTTSADIKTKSVDVILKITTILKEMRIAQLWTVLNAGEGEKFVFLAWGMVQNKLFFQKEYSLKQSITVVVNVVL